MATMGMVSGRRHFPTIREVQMKAWRLLRQVRLRAWRKLTSMRAMDCRGIFGIARMGKYLRMPAKPPQLSKFVIDKKSYEDTDSMNRILRDHLWPETHDRKATPITRPEAHTQREQYPCPQELEEGEVGKLMNKLKTGKAAGIDGVPNEILKWTKDIVVPYLECLFKACIALRHEPDQFKEARTVILRKPEKDNYTDPGNWRPIALLPSIGKLLEAIIAHRLRDLNSKHGILPATSSAWRVDALPVHCSICCIRFTAPGIRNWRRLYSVLTSKERMIALTARNFWTP